METLDPVDLSSSVHSSETASGIYIDDDADKGMVIAAPLQSKINRPLMDNAKDDLLDDSIPDNEAHDFLDLHDVSIIAAVEKNREFSKDVSRGVEGGDYSSSSEGTMDNQHSGQTYPETPPTPLSFESRASSHSSSSFGSGILLPQTPLISKGHPPPLLSIPLSASYDTRTLNMNSSGNRLPDRVQRSRTEIMGRSIFSCFNGDADVSPRSEHGNRKDVFRRRPDIVANCDSEEALEMAAQRIRNQLLLTEMVELAAKAERAADSGYDRFTGHPLCVFPNDIRDPSNRRRRTTHAMRRSFSEGAYIPSSPSTRTSPPRRTTSSNLSAAVILEQELNESMTAKPQTGIRKLEATELRDINDVVPNFNNFHRQLQTHFIRGKVLHHHLLFQEVLPTGLDAINEQPISKLPPPSPLNAICRSSDEALSLLPMCSNEMTATPLSSVRKTIAPPACNPMPPVNGFLKRFRLDPWTIPHSSDIPELPSTATHLDTEGPDTLDGLLLNSLSEQIWKPQKPYFPKRIDVLPGLEDQSFLPRITIRLHPKMDRRTHDALESELSHEPYMGQDLARSMLSRDTHATDSRSLLDETEYDSCDEYDTPCSDQFDISGWIRNEPVVQLSQQNVDNPDNSLTVSSLLDDPFLTITPPMVNKGFNKRRSNSIVVHEKDDHDVLDIPVPPTIPDFVTPVHLRKMRGTAAVHSQSSSVDLPLHSTTNDEHIFVPEKSTNQDQPIAVGSVPSSVSDPMSPLDVSSVSVVTEETVHRPTQASFVSCHKTLKEKELLEKPLCITVATEGPSETSKSTSNPQSEGILTPKDPEDASSDLPFPISPDRDIPIAMSLGPDPQSSQPMNNTALQVLNTISDLPTVQKSMGCHSFGDFATHDEEQDCVCLSPSAGSSTCSVSEPTKRRESIPKSPSTGALDDVKFFNEFVEQFGKNLDHPRATSLPKHSIRDAMELLSSKLSPKRYNRHDAKRRALYARMKENDEFLSNFLYCSKPADAGMDDAPSTKGTSFLCLDGSMACGETDPAGYCCTTSWLEDALTLGHRWQNRPAGAPVQSCVKLSGVTPVAPAPHGSSWLDLAPLDGTWAGTHPYFRDPPAAGGVLHTSFQAPLLKKTRNLYAERSSWNPEYIHRG